MQIYLFRVYLHFFEMVKIMRCPKCGKECNESNSIVSNTYICPFCGDNFSQDGKDREDIKQIAKKLVEEYGIEILENVNRMNALLMDYAPHSDKERKLIVMVMREGITSQLMKLVNESEDNQRLKINRCVNQLIDSIWITEAAANYAVSVLATAIGINIEVGTPNQVHIKQQGIDVQAVNSISTEKILTKEDEVTSEDAIQYALKDCYAIGYKALAANLNIKHLILPDNVKSVYSKAFLNCVNLCSITLPNDIKTIGICAFEGCSSLAKIQISDGQYYRVIDGVLIDKINKRVLRVENDTSKEKINIVNGVSVICKKSFDRSPVKYIYIPTTIEHIEENAFYLTQNLEKFEVDSKNVSYRAVDGVLHNKTVSVLVKYPQGKKDIGYYVEDTVEEIGMQAFSCAVNIQTVTFSSSLKRIGDRAFEYCSNIENIMLPGNIEIIGDRAFQYCEKMRSVMLSRNIQEIGDYAFLNCVSLETISIPRNVSKIGNMAFAYCSNLKSITVQDNVSFVGDGAFIGCDRVEILIKNNPYMETFCHSRGIKFTKI